jgi:hypothetical protein
VGVNPSVSPPGRAWPRQLPPQRHRKQLRLRRWRRPALHHSTWRQHHAAVWRWLPLSRLSNSSLVVAEMVTVPSLLAASARVSTMVARAWKCAAPVVTCASGVGAGEVAPAAPAAPAAASPPTSAAASVLQLLKRHLSVCFARAAAALLHVRVHDRVVEATVVEVRKADSVERRSLARCPCLIRLVELRSDLRSDGSVACST